VWYNYFDAIMIAKDEIETMARAIVMAVSALETSPILGKKTALLLLLVALPHAEKACGVAANRRNQSKRQKDG